MIGKLIYIINSLYLKRKYPKNFYYLIQPNVINLIFPKLYGMNEVINRAIVGLETFF